MNTVVALETMSENFRFLQLKSCLWQAFEFDLANDSAIFVTLLLLNNSNKPVRNWAIPYIYIYIYIHFGDSKVDGFPFISHFLLIKTEKLQEDDPS